MTKIRRINNLHRVQNRRSGFTLLELLLALGLSTALLAAISTSMFNFYHWRDAGERQIDQARTWLAVTQKLGDDLLQASFAQLSNQMFADPIPVRPNEAMEISERVLDLGFDFSLDPLVLYGESDFLTLGQMLPTESLKNRTAEKTALVQRVVVWSSQPSEHWRIPYLNSLGIVKFRSLGPEQNAVSFVRRGVLLNSTPLRMLEQASFPTDVSQLRFRYYDGQTWGPRWNSHVQQALPVAVEASFTLAGESQPVKHLFHLPSSQSQQETL